MEIVQAVDAGGPEGGLKVANAAELAGKLTGAGALS